MIDHTTASRILVTGAGDPAANGIYSRSSELFCNAPQWFHESSSFRLFWGGDCSGGWIIGTSTLSGSGYCYTYTTTAISDAFRKDQYDLLDHLLNNPHMISESEWLTYITGMDRPNHTGGLAPAPTLSLDEEIKT